jgi:hypothetical protein
MRGILGIGVAFFIILAAVPLAQADMRPPSYGTPAILGYLSTVLIEALFLFVFLRKMVSGYWILPLSALLNICSYPLILASILSFGFFWIFIAETLAIIIEAVILTTIFYFLAEIRKSTKKLSFTRFFCISLVMNLCSFFAGLALFYIIPT